jgi:hypothetical protein
MPASRRLLSAVVLFVADGQSQEAKRVTKEGKP